MQEIRKIRRENVDKEGRRRLMREDDREEKELRSYVAQQVAEEMVNSLPGRVQGEGSMVQEIKVPEARQSGTAEWVNERGEGGLGREGVNGREGGP